MKTTVHIPDTLMEEARKIANQEGTTVKAIIEEGLRRAIENRKRKHAFTHSPGALELGQPATGCGRRFLGENT